LNKKLNILICPLEWGLGHAARMIPVAKLLHERGHNVTIGAGAQHLSFFKAELPSLSFIEFPGFKPSYSRVLPQYLVMLIKTPLLVFHIISEHKRLNKLIADNQIDIVISDNRFGLWNKKITCVYVTHMLCIPFPWPFRFLEITGILIHRYIINKYSFCFVPDLPGDLNLSGRLSHNLNLPENVIYTGILSRFSMSDHSRGSNFITPPHITIILSGPEPQRTILETKLRNELIDSEDSIVILKGKPGIDESEQTDANIISYNHLCSMEMADVLRTSKGIISRSGYTTIMDLASLGCSALLIPTPGQTEQEYLADYLAEKNLFVSLRQNKIQKKLRIPDVLQPFPDDINEQSRRLLESAVNKMLENVEENR
jgi:UDP-N-acetylglucosamine transferase subunit ALG13